MSTQNDVNPTTLTDDAVAPNKSYELSGKIMLSAIVILFAVVIFMVFLHLYARWYLLRSRQRQLQRRNRTRRRNIVFYVDSDTPVTAGSTGLDPSVIKSLPVVEFKKEGDGGNPDKVSECAVCLSEFEEGEKGRSLPKCGHSFHIECIDMWFASHSTCPLCRAPVEATSVAEVVKSVEPSQLVAESSVPSTSSFRVESKGFSVEIPLRRNGSLETEESPSSFKSPGGKMMSFRRMLSRGLSNSSPVDVSSHSACCDLEMGVNETSKEPVMC